MTFQGSSFLSRASNKLITKIQNNPMATLRKIALCRLRRRMGKINIEEKINLAINVKIVEFQTSKWVRWFSDSCEKCMPIASENESARAMVNIPPITTSRDCVIEFRPTIKPRVVTMPEGRPKLNPILNARFIVLYLSLIHISEPTRRRRAHET